ncbi:MAG: molybdenum cofactor biosynthesis protein MoaA [Candidatus Methanomethylicota archaeon]|uniref:Molybdenum cofactor biosynthesis protein MoaA n=1 Tax=Thermoproteota archaeon TaxID=2056631 RepID=A0A497EX41_9CREN|nr:MAG: molybdenum cofactor biosynthesis protein MoaA [Candidatus Verstraetearchaeota archaeon]
MVKLFDPIKLSDAIGKIVTRGEERKYYRVARGGRWYGGIATADCCGCNLKCVFCWSGYPRDRPDKVGRFYTPRQIYEALDKCARRRGYRLIRVSGNEPTIGKEHLLKLLELVDQDGRYLFILETNGILLGYDKLYAKQLSKFKNIHVRVSLKGTTRQEFSKLTGAIPEAFDYQLMALQNLLDYGVKCHPAAMLSFSTKEGIRSLISRLMEIDPILVDEFEEEYVFLYPHVVERLKKAGLKPNIAYTPNNIPKELI